MGVNQITLDLISSKGGLLWTLAVQNTTVHMLYSLIVYLDVCVWNTKGKEYILYIWFDHGLWVWRWAGVKMILILFIVSPSILQTTCLLQSSDNI